MYLYFATAFVTTFLSEVGVVVGTVKGDGIQIAEQFREGPPLAKRPLGTTGGVPQVTVTVDRGILDDLLQRPAAVL